MFTIGTIVICMTAGTAVIMWLGELITDRGVGNGMSLMIFTQVIAVIPGEMEAIYEQHARVRVRPRGPVVGIAIIAFVALMEQAQRRIPVQYAKRMVGRRMYGGTSTYIPLKVNQAGVIPVIFASSLLYIPQLAAQLFGNANGKTVPAWVTVGDRQPGPAEHGDLRADVLRAHRLLHLLLRVDHLQSRLRWPTT